MAHRSGGLHLVRLLVIWGSSLSVVKIQQTIKTNIHTIYFLRAAALYKVMTDPSLKCLRDTSDSAPDDPIYSASPRPATQDRAAGSPAAAGGAATQDRPAPAPAAADRAAPADAPSPARVAAGTEAGLQSAANGVNIANDVVRGGQRRSERCYQRWCACHC